jgi:hypothetical protein
MANPDTAILCKDFSYTKNWSVSATLQPETRVGKDTGNQPPPRQQPPVQPPPVGNSTISGQIFGKRYVDAATEPGGKIERITLKYVVIEPIDNSGRRKSIPVRITNRGKFSFTTGPGKKYKIYPAAFRSDPQFQIVTTRPNVTHIVNFKIIGGPIID